jgi:hypothetical protein
MQLARRISAWLIASTVTGLACASAGNEPAETPEPYAALAPLIGEWNVGPPGAATAFVERFSWGPNRAYIQFSVTLIVASGEEHLHMDGMVIWNAATRRFDYLLAVEPGSLAQEQGEFYLNDAGDIVREVVLTDADGATGQFRQTFHAMNDGRFGVSLLRQTAGGWTSTFPGSDQLIMARRTG